MITIRLYRYGIDITNATLQTKAYELGIEKAVSEMTQAEKMQLRMLAILEQSKVSWGDLANTINSPSNMIRQFTNNLKEAGMILGQLFIPLLQKVLPILNGVMIALKRLLVAIANFFGIKLDLSGFGQGFSGLEENVDGVGDSLDDATNSAKKFKKQLAGFDELENLSSETGNSKLGVGGAGIDLTDEILKATAEYEKAFADAMARMENDAQKWADRIVEFFTTGNVGGKISKVLTDALNSIDWNSVYAVAKDFGTGLASFLNSLITPDLFGAVGRTIAGLLNTAIYTALSFGEEFDWENFGLSIASGINNFFDTFDFTALAESLNAWVGGLWTTIKTAIFGDESGEGGIDFGKIFRGINEFASALEPLTAFVLLIASVVPVMNLFSSIMSALTPYFTVLSGIMGIVNAGFSAFTGFIASASAPVLLLVGAISALVIGLTDAYVKNEDVRESFAQAVDLIAQNFTPALELITKTVIPDLQNGWKRVTEIMKPFGDFLQNTFVSIWQDMINPALSYIGNTVLPTLITTLENLWSKILVPFATFVGNVFAPIIRLISGLLEMLWKNIIVPLANMIGGVLSSVFEGLAGILNNTIIPVVGFVIDLFNTLWNYVFGPLVDFLVDNFLPIFESVFETIGGLIDGATKIFTGLIDFVSGVFSLEWGKAWEGVKDVFKGIFNGIASIVEGVINFIIGAINTFLNGFNGVVTSVGDVIGIDISIPTIPKVEIPKFATGGFPQQYSLFMAGENGIPEIAGTVGGKTAVAGGAEITGIRQEIRATANEEMALLRQQNALLQAILEKEFGISQDALFSSVRNSANDYHRRTGNFAFNI